jgi:RimJ/RimL family protein N-acetyltransferase
MSQAKPVFLRPLEMDDLDRVHKWHNDPELFSNLVNPFRHVSRSAESHWLERKISYDSKEINLAICESATGTHIGNIYL